MTFIDFLCSYGKLTKLKYYLKPTLSIQIIELEIFPSSFSFHILPSSLNLLLSKINQYHYWNQGVWRFLTVIG